MKNENELVTLCSYNILANCYCDISLYKDYDPSFLNWTERKKKLIEELENLSTQTDIFCLQEVDCFEEVVENALKRDYDSVFKKRTGLIKNKKNSNKIQKKKH